MLDDIIRDNLQIIKLLSYKVDNTILDKGSRKNKFTFLALKFRLGLVDFREQKTQ